jgi:hypothetical protein
MADAMARGPAAVPVGQSQTPAETAPAYTGKLLRGKTEGSVEGWLTDRLGCRIHFRGRLDTSRKGAGYDLVSTNVYIPEKLRVAVIDDTEERPMRVAGGVA